MNIDNDLDLDLPNFSALYEPIPGEVKIFNPETGWGFIFSGGQDYFVHQFQVKGGLLLKPKQRVTFTPKLTHRGYVATMVIPSRGFSG